VSGNIQIQNLGEFRATANGSYSYIHTPVANQANLVLQAVVANTTLTISSFSVREVPGNHATQATSTARPTLRNRYNLLASTQDFSTSSWAGVAINRAATSISETGANSIHQLAPNVGSNAANQPAVFSIEVLPNGRDRVHISWANNGSHYAAFHLSGAGSVVSSQLNGIGSIQLLQDGYYRISLAHTPTIAGASFYGLNLADAAYPTNPTPSYAGDGVSGVFVRNASLTTAADASLPYQRVTTATDYDSDPAKFPLRLNADGSDDALLLATLGTINPTAGAFELFVAFRFASVDTNSSSSWMNDQILADAGGWASLLYARSSGHIGASGGTNNGQKIEIATDIRARHIWHARLAGGQLTVSLDGGPEQSVVCANWGNTTGAMRLFQSLSGFTDGHLHELIFRDGSVSAGDRASAISYLKTKWGVA
jgi:hypothetical protein